MTTSIDDLLDRYLAARGLSIPDGTSARKVAEPDRDRVAHELADVVLAAAVVARAQIGLEDAIESKVRLDTGRDL